MSIPPSDRDPLVDKLLALFAKADPPPDSVSEFRPWGWNGGSVTPLAGIPIEEAASQVRAYYVALVVVELDRIEQDTEKYGDWDPAHWVVVAPPYLFPGNWTAINRVALLSDNDAMPDWEVFIVRSATWWTKQLEDQEWPAVSTAVDAASSILADMVADRIAKARRNTFEVVRPTDFTKITGA